jgi:FtsH-binding integral membrane protein
MHIRRLATFLLGAWLACSLLLVLVAARNLTAADRLVAAHPTSAASSVEILGENGAQTFLRIQASELNRYYFETWEWAQLALGVILLVTLVASSSGRRSGVLLCFFMLLTVVVVHFGLTPQVTRLGRLLDVIPPDQPSPERHRLWSYNTAYSVVEGIKYLFGLMLLSSLLRRHAGPPEEGGQRKWMRAH